MVKKDNIGVQDLRIQDEGKGLSGFGLGIWGVRVFQSLGSGLRDLRFRVSRVSRFRVAVTGTWVRISVDLSAFSRCGALIRLHWFEVGFAKK